VAAAAVPQYEIKTNNNQKKSTKQNTMHFFKKGTRHNRVKQGSTKLSVHGATRGKRTLPLQHNNKEVFGFRLD